MLIGSFSSTSKVGSLETFKTFGYYKGFVSSIDNLESCFTIKSFEESVIYMQFL